MIFMIQKELAEKFNYRATKMNKYKFICELCSKYEILFNVSNNVFIPKPKVKSNVVKFSLKNHKYKSNNIIKFTNKIFLNKRKKIKSKIQISNTLDNNLLNKRIEDLNFDQLLKIYKFI